MKLDSIFHNYLLHSLKECYSSGVSHAFPNPWKYSVESFLQFPPTALHIPVSLTSILSIVILYAPESNLCPILLNSFLPAPIRDARAIARQ